MKVVHLNTSSGWGGGEEQLLQLMRGLRERDVNSVLLARSGSELFQRVLREPLLSAEPSDVGSRHNPLTIRRLRKTLRHLEADLLHLHDGHAAAMGLLAARGLPGLRVVVHRRTSSRMRRNPVSRSRYRSDRIDAYIAVSEAARASLREIGVPSERIHVVPSGIDVQALVCRTERNESRRELGVNGQPLIGTVGALEPKKDLSTFVGAAEILARTHPELRFLIVGGGGERAALERQALSAGLEGCLHFTGKVPDACRTIAAMDVFVFPSLHEGSPGVVKEAMALGVPVVAADAPGTVEVVSEDTGILVPRGQPAHFADAIRGVLDRPEQSTEMARRALRRLESQYSIDDTVDRTVQVYRGVL